MQRGIRKVVLAVGLATSGFVGQASAQLPPPPGPAPATLWSFLGIPQGYRSFRDNAFNRNGNRPGLERKPPLKAIAAPENLKSPNPAIKKAAEIKAEEDLKKQKIKAIKYLASIGCGCYNRDGSITDALLKSMDDCTEEVRLATVQSISLAAAGEYCANCKQKSCCSEELSNKLYEIAYERDETGCYLEPSERVRLAAAEALRVCCPGTGDNIIYEQGPVPTMPQGGVEQPSVLPEGGVERPGISVPPLVPTPNPMPPAPAPILPPVPAPAPLTQPAPIIPRSALPPIVPAPAVESSPAPRSSRRTATLNGVESPHHASKSAASASNALAGNSNLPHWTPETTKTAVSAVPAPAATAAVAKPAGQTANVIIRVPVAQPPAGVEAKTAQLTRLPPVEQASGHVALPAVTTTSTPAIQVSTRKEAGEPAKAPQPSSRRTNNRINQMLKTGTLPGQEFGSGTVTKVRAKEGMAILEFDGVGSVPVGSIIRAYHEYALTGKSAVCDLEVVDGEPGMTVVVARSGSELASLSVGDQAVVLQ